MSSGLQAAQRTVVAARPAITAELLAKVLREIEQPFLVTSEDGKLLLWNPAFEQLSGYSPAQLAEMILDDLATSPRIGDSRTLTTELRSRAGTPIQLELRAGRLRDETDSSLTLWLVKSPAEQQPPEEELQSQKMEAIGKLAGGIAHDFNNVLTTILSLSEAMIQGHTPPNSESLKEIHHAAKHAAELTHHLLAFSRRQILQKRPLRLDGVVENLAKMLRRVIGEDVMLEIICRPPLPPVRGDQSQIEQVLMNLCLNARDAMPDGGNLRIELGAETVSERAAAQHPGGRSGSYVRLTVHDTGVGMDEATLARIFEPFFTSKGLGKGTGLGLAMVYGIVQQHDGFIHVSSNPGVGTEFTVYFPAAQAEPEAAGQPEPAPAARAGSATILVVEDEKSVRKLVMEVLPKLGYKVLSAADGEEAIRVFDRWADQIDLVLLDAILPKFAGRQVYDAIRKRKPTVRFVFTSGYNEDFINRRFELDPGWLFLRKPFSTKDLSAMIRAALQ
jgi:PAS domain S-box-containing protein